MEKTLKFSDLSDEVLSGMATGEAFAVVIQGDSLEPRFSEGDVFMVQRQPDVDSGEFAVLRIGEQAICAANVYKKKDYVILQSRNPNHDPQHFTNDEVERLPVRIIGRVLEGRRKL